MVIREKAGKKKGALPGGGGLPDPLYRGIHPIKSDDSHLYLPVFATLIILGDRGRVRFWRFHEVLLCPKLPWQTSWVATY